MVKKLAQALRKYLNQRYDDHLIHRALMLGGRLHILSRRDQNEYFEPHTFSEWRNQGKTVCQVHNEAWEAYTEHLKKMRRRGIEHLPSRRHRHLRAVA